MKRFKLLCLAIGLALGMSTVQINAKETVVAPRSGGIVSTKEYVDSKQKLSDTNSIRYFTSDWARTSQYSITSSFSVGSTATLGVSAGITSDLNSMGINYGISVNSSSTVSVGRVIPANSKRNSKLRFRAVMHNYHIKIRTVMTYYDTSKGYYTQTYYREGNISYPDRNMTYVEVIYQ